MMGSAASGDPKDREDQAIYLQWLLADDERVRGAFSPIWNASVIPGADFCVRTDLEAALQPVAARLGQGIVRLRSGESLDEKAALAVFRLALKEFATSSPGHECVIQDSEIVSSLRRSIDREEGPNGPVFASDFPGVPYTMPALRTDDSYEVHLSPFIPSFEGGYRGSPRSPGGRRIYFSPRQNLGLCTKTLGTPERLVVASTEAKSPTAEQSLYQMPPSAPSVVEWHLGSSALGSDQESHKVLQLELAQSLAEGEALDKALVEKRTQIAQQATDINILDQDLQTLEARLASAIMPEDPSEVSSSLNAQTVASEDDDAPLSLEAMKQQLEILPQLQHQVITLEDELAGRASEAAVLQTKLQTLRSEL